jgi:hypothetical protein
MQPRRAIDNLLFVIAAKVGSTQQWVLAPAKRLIDIRIGHTYECVRDRFNV